VPNAPLCGPEFGSNAARGASATPVTLPPPIIFTKLGPERAAQVSPSSEMLASSDDLGWRSIVVRAYSLPDERDGFTTGPIPDLLVSLNIGGVFTVESRRLGGWTRARPQPTSIGIKAPGRYETLRWHSDSCTPMKLLHMFVSADMLHETAEGLGRPGLSTRVPDALHVEDPLLVVIGRALLSAVVRRAEPLHADSLAQSLALHMVYGRSLASEAPRPWQMPGALSSVALERVVDYMHSNLGMPLLLEDLAAVASISKFHFVRGFKLATGEPPHRHLTRLRMQLAAKLLRTSRDTVQQISAACGYASAGQFANAFRRHHGASPTQYRREAGH